jgi:mono/diheme cytochrome c family protein
MADTDKTPRSDVVRRRAGRPTIPIGFRPAPSDDELETTVLERWQGWGLLLTIFLAVLLPLYVVVYEPVRVKNAALEQRRESIERGAKHFALSTEANTTGYGCAQCHGANAQGGVAANFRPPGSGADAKPVDVPAPELRTVFKRQLDQNKTPREAYRFVYQTIAQGRPGTPMPTWGLAFGGPLNDQQIEDIINYLISIQEGVPEGTEIALGAARGPFSRLMAYAGEDRS